MGGDHHSDDLAARCADARAVHAVLVYPQTGRKQSAGRQEKPFSFLDSLQSGYDRALAGFRHPYVTLAIAAVSIVADWA